MKNKFIIPMLLALFSFSNFSVASYTPQDLLREGELGQQNAVEVNQNLDKIQPTIDLFKEVFSSYQKGDLEREIPNLYSKRAFLNDRIHSVTGVDSIKKYFLGTFNKIYKANFEIQDISFSKKDVYIRWVMVIHRNKRSSPIKCLGVTQLKFSSDGKIIYHQDHWDFSELLQQIPYFRGVINFIKGRA